MAKSRNTHSAAFKAKVALEAIRERKTSNEIAKQFAIHPTQINQWKRRAEGEEKGTGIISTFESHSLPI